MDQQNPCVAWNMGILASPTGAKETWEVSIDVSGNLDSFELLPPSRYLDLATVHSSRLMSLVVTFQGVFCEGLREPVDDQLCGTMTLYPIRYSHL